MRQLAEATTPSMDIAMAQIFVSRCNKISSALDVSVSFVIERKRYYSEKQTQWKQSIVVCLHETVVSFESFVKVNNHAFRHFIVQKAKNELISVPDILSVISVSTLFFSNYERTAFE